MALEEDKTVSLYGQGIYVKMLPSEWSQIMWHAIIGARMMNEQEVVRNAKRALHQLEAKT